MNRLFHLLLLSSTHNVWSLLLREAPIGSAAGAKTGSDGDDERVSYDEKRLLGGRDEAWMQQVTKSRSGIKRLLAVRVSSPSFGEYPSETLDEMEGAMFGSGPNPLNVPSYSALTAQFRAVSHDQLIYAPAVSPNLTRAGLLEIDIALSMIMMDDSDNTTVQHFVAAVEPAMMAKAETVVGRPLWEIADRVMFCLPSGSLIATAAAITNVGAMVRTCVYVCCFCYCGPVIGCASACCCWRLLARIALIIPVVICLPRLVSSFCSSRITNIQAVPIFMS